MREYRSLDGERCLFFEPEEIEQIMEDELRRAKLLPTKDASVVDLDRLVEQHLGANFDQYAELPHDVLGQTDFRPRRAPAVQINKDLTGSAFDTEWTAPGIEGRWRATVAHEAAHLILHRILFDVDMNQGTLFPEATLPAKDQRLQRCLKRDVGHRSFVSDWKEVQANRGMAALLMPRSVFSKVARTMSAWSGSDATVDEAIRTLATQFGVSRQATTIRLKTLGFIRDEEVELQFNRSN